MRRISIILHLLFALGLMTACGKTPLKEKNAETTTDDLPVDGNNWIDSETLAQNPSAQNPPSSSSVILPPSPSPSTTPPSTETPSYSRPDIVLVRSAPVTTLGEPARVEFRSVGGPIQTLLVNGNSIRWNTVVQMLPQAPNSPNYVFSILATGPGGNLTKQVSFTVPTCSLSILSSSTTSSSIDINLQLNAYGGGSAYSVMGGTTAAISAASITKSISLPYQSGLIQIDGLVRNAAGDGSSCSTSLTAPSLPSPALSGNNEATYSYIFGYRATKDEKTAMTGSGASNTTGYFTNRTKSFSVKLITGETYNRSRYCESNEVVVGFQATLIATSSLKPICQQIDPSFELFNTGSYSSAMFFGASLDCPSGQVMTGSDYNEYSNTFSITCSSIRWK